MSKHELILYSSLHQSTEILFQYVEFLLQHLTPERYAALVPSYPDLAEKFGLSPSLAFLLLRPKLSLDMKVSPSPVILLLPLMNLLLDCVGLRP